MPELAKPELVLSPLESTRPVRVGKHFRRLVESGIDTALQHLWQAVFLVIIAVVAGLWYWLKGSGAFPTLGAFIVGFLTAATLMVITSLSLLLIRRRREGAIKQLSDAAWVSQQKGWLDHAANLEIADQQYRKFGAAIGQQIGAMGKIAIGAGAQLEKVKRDPDKARRAASLIAGRFHRHAAKLDQSVMQFEDITKLLIESDAGYSQWLINGGHTADVLITSRANYIDRLNRAEGALAAIKNFRDLQPGVLGISQDLNTAFNRLLGITDHIMDLLTTSRDRWREGLNNVNAALQRSQTTSVAVKSE